MFLRIFLLIMLYPILPIIYFVLRNEVKPKKNIMLGITLPRFAQNDPAVTELCNDFKRDLKRAAILLAPVPFVVFFIQSTSIMMMVLMYWLLLAMIVPYISYTKYHRRLKALKEEQEWAIATEQKSLVDLKVAAGQEVQIQEWLFAPAIIISAFPLVYELTTGLGETHISVLVSSGIFLLTTVLFYVFYRFASRQRTEIIDEDSMYNLTLTRIRRNNWARFWLWAAWINAFYCLILWLSITARISFTVFMIATVVYTVAILWAAMKAEFAVRNMQYKLASESTAPIYMDEDRYWLNGMFYYNPHDKRTMISSRVGINMGVNMARPAGKILMVFVFLSMLTLPLFPVWLVAEEFTPIKVEVVDSTIVISHLTEISRIYAAEIEEVEIIEDLPRSRRLVGTGLDNLKKGTFDVDGYGRGRLYLNPQEPPFMLIRTQQGYMIINKHDKVLDVISP